ncbi:efflux RND transporter periplasmic adaptor subunit [Burkholderiaceae bacterium UC74_6]
MKNFIIRNKGQALAVALVLGVGLAIGAAVLRSGGSKPAGAEAHVEEEHGHEAEGGHARITDEQLQHNGIALATAGPARIGGALQLLGDVRLNQDRAVFVTPRLAGIVESVHANAGDRVRRGQLLAVISSQALGDQRAEALAAQRRLVLARSNHDRALKLWDERIIAEQSYQEVRQALQEAEIAADRSQQKLAVLGTAAVVGNLTRYEVRAPIAGLVVDKRLSVGEALKEDAMVFQLADLSTVWVELIVPTQELQRLKLGAMVSVSTPGLTGEGKLGYIGALIGEQSRNALARVVLPNPRSEWRPGLPVTVSVHAQEGEVPVAVEAEALQTLDGAPVVFVREGQGFEARAVKPGRADGHFVEVLQGLKAGERYAVKNSFLVKADLGKAAAEHEH